MKKLLIGVIVFVMALSFTLPLYAGSHDVISENASENAYYGQSRAYYSPGVTLTRDWEIGRYKNGY